MKTLPVFLDQLPAGEITQAASGLLHFQYLPEYTSNPSNPPLSVSMPKEQSTHEHHLIAPWLEGLLPENPIVRQRWAQRFGVSTQPFALLSSPIGQDCAGAVSFSLTATNSVDEISAAELAERIRAMHRDSAAWLGESGQFSLAGAQAKMALIHRAGRYYIPSGSMPTTHIIKPAIAGFPGHDLNEHLCLEAARRLGISAVKSNLLTVEDQSALLVERYDRHLNRRIHQEDICQALSLYPEQKYQNQGGPSPSAIANLLHRVGSPADIATFADALLWNWIIAGTDAHAKNYSLLLDADTITLAPLYDIASALPYAHPRKLRMAMKVGGEYRVEPWTNIWSAAAIELGIEPTQLTSRAEALLNAAPDAFADAARVINRASPLPELIASRKLHFPQGEIL